MSRKPIRQRIREMFAATPQETPASDPFFVGEETGSRRDRSYAQYRNLIDEALHVWRDDPLARRIVSLTTQFSIGRGFRISADDPATERFLLDFWEHTLNNMPLRISEWSDELCRTGNLFILISSDSAGRSFVRAIPAGQIEEIIPMENNIEQPLFFRMRELSEDACRIPEEKMIPAADLQEPTEAKVMLHFTVNRAIGAQWGEPDLTPVLKWIRMYESWLNDRFMLNHYRNSFIFVVRSPNSTEAGRANRQRQLNMGFDPGDQRQ